MLLDELLVWKSINIYKHVYVYLNMKFLCVPKNKWNNLATVDPFRESNFGQKR